MRLVASFGAGGVLYLTPMVFHQADFSASQVGTGLALAALAGTIGRFVSGWLLDRGLSCGLPVLLAALCGFCGDALLLGAHNQSGYIAGQLLLGSAGGLYWPAVELAVPLCSAPVPSARGYALSRTADAAGVASGTLNGSLLSQLGHLRGVYMVATSAVHATARFSLWPPSPRVSEAGFLTLQDLAAARGVCRRAHDALPWAEWQRRVLACWLPPLPAICAANPALRRRLR